MPELDEELKDKETENLQDIDNAGEAGKEDELLSDAEIKRIADMNLDDIIEDATSDSVSVEDLFGNGDSAAEASQENADEPVQAASQPEEKSDKASAEQAEAVQKQQLLKQNRLKQPGHRPKNQNRRNKRKHKHRLNREKNRKLPDQRINLIKRKKIRRQRKPKRIKKDSLAQSGIFSLKVLRKSRKKRQAMSFFQERKCRKIQKMRMNAF